MHVLVLTQNNVSQPSYGGALRVGSLVRGLVLEGHRVSVVRFVSPGEPSSIACDIPVHDVGTPLGYPTAPLAASFHLFERSALRYALKLNRNEPVDLVQSDPPWASLTGARIARRLGVPHVVLSQNCETTLAKQFSQHGPARKLPLVGGLLANANLAVACWAEKRAVERAALTLTPSSGDRTEMQRLGMNTTAVQLLPNGTAISPTPWERKGTRAALGLGESEPVAIFVGRLDYLPNREAVDVIVRSIAPACPLVRFLLVGSNPPALELPSNVTMVGQVPSVEPYLAAADLSLVPLLKGSGTRIKILDAWAAGLPVLSTAAGASGLDYTDGVNIVIEDDLSKYPARIAELFSEPSRLQALGEKARAAALPYTWNAISKRHIATLDALCAGRPAPSAVIGVPPRLPEGAA